MTYTMAHKAIVSIIKVICHPSLLSSLFFLHFFFFFHQDPLLVSKVSEWHSKFLKWLELKYVWQILKLSMTFMG
jgi:hypothetical protein